MTVTLRLRVGKPGSRYLIKFTLAVKLQRGPGGGGRRRWAAQGSGRSELAAASNSGWCNRLSWLSLRCRWIRVVRRRARGLARPRHGAAAARHGRRGNLARGLLTEVGVRVSRTEIMMCTNSFICKLVM